MRVALATLESTAGFRVFRAEILRHNRVTITVITGRTPADMPIFSCAPRAHHGDGRRRDNLAQGYYFQRPIAGPDALAFALSSAAGTGSG